MSDVLNDVVLPFVARYDRPFLYNEAIEKLWAAKAFDAPESTSSCSTEELARFVGAHYCAMIREDVYYYLPEAIQYARRSRDAAQELKQRLKTETDADWKYRYVLIRWTDALARIYYRTGNYALARVEFGECLKLMGDGDAFYWCRTDIVSNLQRTTYEIALQAGDPQSKAAECCKALKEAAEFGESKLANEGDETRQLELRRGIVSAYHNLSHCGLAWPAAVFQNVANGKRLAFGSLSALQVPLAEILQVQSVTLGSVTDAARVADSSQFDVTGNALQLNCSQLPPGQYELNIALNSNRFTVQLNDKLSFEAAADKIRQYIGGDVYREAQFINSEAQHARTRGNDALAQSLFEQLLSSPWPRGRFIGTQNLAAIKEQRDTLLNLCQQIDVESRANGGFDVLDLERFNFTLSMAEKLVGKMDGGQKEKLKVYQRSITQAVSSVISIASYRQIFEKRIRERVQGLVEDRVNQFLSSASTDRSAIKELSQQFDELIDFTESFVAREVLEVLRNNRSQKARPEANSDFSKFLVADSVEQLDELESEQASSTVVAALSSGDSDSDSADALLPVLPLADFSTEQKREIESNAESARQSDELYWLDNPLRIREAPGSPSQRARQVTINEPRTLVLRFAVIGAEKKHKHIVAFWWYRGKAFVTNLGTDALETSQDFAAPYDDLRDKYYFSKGLNTRIPKMKNAQRLWQIFFAQVLTELQQKFSVNEAKIDVMTIILEAGLFHLPLNLAWVPHDMNVVFEKGEVDAPLAQACNLSFSLNMTSHFLDGRREFGSCLRLADEDDLVVLQYSKENDFAGADRMERVANVVARWGEQAEYSQNAGVGEISKCLNERAEFLMFACHGAALKSGPVLAMNGCRLVSYNLSYSVALNGNRLLILGACDSATPSADSYGQFIGAFVAAGAGALLANPCLAMIPTVCGVSASILNLICDSPTNGAINLAAALRDSALALSKQYPFDGECNDIDRKLWSSTFQLWL